MLKNICKTFCFQRKYRSIISLSHERHRLLSTEDKTREHVKSAEISQPIESTFESINRVLKDKSLKDLLNEASSELESIGSGAQELTQRDINESIAKRDQKRLSLRPKTAPEDTTVMLFPGQGSQFVGMGYHVIDSPNVKQMFTIAKQILGYDLLDLCLNGPIERLNQTQFSQPAIFVTSLAAVESLRQSGSGDVESCVATAGFSVGELAALVFAGALSFEDGLRLVKIRAEAMQYATELVPSAMITVFFNADARINFACNAAKEWCLRKGVQPEYAVCSVANYLFPHCKVVAGHEEAISFLQMNAKDFGIKKTKRLPVSGAFHTSLMAPAREVMREALKRIRIDVPLIPVHSNFDARVYSNADDIRKKLAKQIVSPVRWEQILHIIYERPKETKCPKTFECGPGTSLLSTLNMVHGIARRSARHVPV
ncbi:unnamed protein product [Medioppia subpectinata]|uniref:[acyl-carrier-protein] S-malonyltransferase n=1 Tax=Medioppia subpectinata TaxID=1979941 RepID=A0A7R9PZ39_9ACAR|nr:unnamed protein product [Medioppia subpectinata]CAG2106522.1 unnamed protein product [Medioppia subpectinata]